MISLKKLFLAKLNKNKLLLISSSFNNFEISPMIRKEQILSNELDGLRAFDPFPISCPINEVEFTNILNKKPL